MKTATLRLKIGGQGSDVKLKNITPPELVILVVDHHRIVGGNPVVDGSLKEELFQIEEMNDQRECVLSEDGTSSLVDPPWSRDKWTNAAEKRRLANKYGQQKVDTIFPGASAMPDDWQEAAELGLNTSLPENKMTSVDDRIAAASKSH